MKNHQQLIQRFRKEFKRFIKPDHADYFLLEKFEAHLIEEVERVEKRITNAVESQDFYELMQAYRHMPLVKQKETVEAFEDVKKFIINSLKQK